MTTSEGTEALLRLGPQAQENELVAARAYNLSVSVRPTRLARALWVRDRVEATRTTLDRTPDRYDTAVSTRLLAAIDQGAQQGLSTFLGS